MNMRALPALMLAFVLAMPAEAQLKKSPSPAGEWGFKTEPMGAGCTLAGEMTVTQMKDKSYTCKFTAVWSCQMRAPKLVETEQTCIATQTGPHILMTSRMSKVSKVDPVEMLEAMRERYAADNFDLTMNERGDEMTGLFKSYGMAPVKFARHKDLIS